MPLLVNNALPVPVLALPLPAACHPRPPISTTPQSHPIPSPHATQRNTRRITSTASTIASNPTPPHPRSQDYIYRLDNFDGPAVADKAIEFGLFEEAYEIYKKFNKRVEAIKVGG